MPAQEGARLSRGTTPPAVACMERHRGGLTTGHPTIRARESSLRAKAPEFMTAPVASATVFTNGVFWELLPSPSKDRLHSSPQQPLLSPTTTRRPPHHINHHPNQQPYIFQYPKEHAMEILVRPRLGHFRADTMSSMAPMQTHGDSGPCDPTPGADVIIRTSSRDLPLRPRARPLDRPDLRALPALAGT